MPVIEARGLGKRFILGEARRGRSLRESLADAAASLWHRGSARFRARELWALRDVSFDVAQGEVLGIIGVNGSGKSTLLRILSRITTPTEGSAVVRGRVASLLEVGTGFHPDLTGRENVQLNGAILGMRRREIARLFDRIVAFAGVEEFLDTPVKRYSSGMRMRLAFAVAAHLEPDVLIVDEVLAVGDLAFQQRCLGKMSEVAHSGRTVLFVSHNMAAVEQLCERALLLERGRLVADGPVGEVVSDHLARATAGPTLAGLVASSRDGALRAERLEILDDDGRRLGAVQSGRDFLVRLELDVGRALHAGVVEIALLDALGARVSVLHSGVAGAEVELSPGRHRVECRVRDLPLVPGHYGLEIKLLSGDDVLVHEPHAAALRVEGGDFFGTGRLPAAGWEGRCLVRQSWSIEDAKPEPAA